MKRSSSGITCPAFPFTNKARSVGKYRFDSVLYFACREAARLKHSQGH